MKALEIKDFLAYQDDGVDVLDTRDVAAFKEGFVPSAVNVPLEGVKDWAGDVLEKDKPLMIIAAQGREEETLVALKAAGFEKIIGYLNGGFEAWQKAGNSVDMIIDVESDELMMDIPFDDRLIVVDVRKPIEFAEGHLKNAVNLPLSEITDPLKMAQFEETDNLYLHCGGGTRSVIAASVLKKNGIHNLRNISGGWKKIKEEPKADIVKEPNVLN